MVILERVRQIISHISPLGHKTHTEPSPGLSYHVGRTDKPLKHITLAQLLREQVDLNGDSEALVSAWQQIRWTYRELERLSDGLAQGFWGLGVRKGDRMAIMAGNCGEYVLVLDSLRRGLSDYRLSLQLQRLVPFLRSLIRRTKKKSLNLLFEQLVHPLPGVWS